MARRTAPGVFIEGLESRLLLTGDLLITEFMASNKGTLADEDGDYSDWVELHNPTSASRNLDGYYLTDEAGDLTKWRLPEMMLPAGGYLVVFASEKDRRDPWAPLHTNFSLKAEGEYLALVAPDGSTVLNEFAPKYPAQQGDVSYGLQGSTTLVASGVAAKALVPSGSVLGRTWTSTSFDDSGWRSGATGVGFDTDGSLAHLINLDLAGQMFGVNASAYIRIPFVVNDPSAFGSLLLRMKFDDGFVAYLNGTRVNARNAPPTIDWQSGATSQRDDAAATAFEEFDLSVHLGLLKAGLNMLAVHGLNRTPANSDFLVLPELLARTADLSTAPLRFFAAPTPGAPNGQGFNGLVADTRFSIDRGFYDTPFQVEITTATAGATIRYTTDGSRPTPAHGVLYTGPITVSTTTTLRAVAFADGYEPSNVDTQTYLFLSDVIRQPPSIPGYPQPTLDTGNGSHLPLDYEMDADIVDSPAYAPAILDAMRSIPTLSIVMNREDMFGGSGVYFETGDSPSNSERPASVEFIYPGRPGGSIQIDAGIKSHSHARLKRSFRLLFKGEYGDSKLKADLFGGSAVREFDRLVLRAGNNRNFVNWWNPDDSTYTRDQWARMSQLAMSGVGAHGAFVHLYINGIYWGLYNPVERPDHFFASAYYGGDEQSYFAVNHSGPVSGDPSRWEYLRGALKDKDMSVLVNYQELEQFLDVEQFADYLIVNWYAGTADWPDNNWYASGGTGGNPTPMRFYVWDAEDIFDAEGSSGPFDQPGGRGTDGAAVPPGFSAWDGPWAGTDIANLFNSAKASPEFRTLFADRVYKHVYHGGALTDINAQARWLSVNNQIREAIIGESARWGDARSTAPGEEGVVRTRDGQWQAEVDRILNHVLPGNGDRLIAALRAEGYYPGIDPPRFEQHGGAVLPRFQLRLSTGTTGGLVYYTLDGSDPRLPGGGISPSAHAYTGPMSLIAGGTVRTRLLRDGIWSPLSEATFTVSPLQITELMYNPQEPSDDEQVAGFTDNDAFEFIELRNVGDTPLDLMGLRLADGVTFDFVGGAVTDLDPGHYVLVVKDLAAFSMRYGGGLPVAGQYTGNLDNGGEHVRLAGPLDQTLVEFLYDDAWQPDTDGPGYSLIRSDSVDGANLFSPASWRASGLPGGSPGGVVLLRGTHSADSWTLREVEGDRVEIASSGRTNHLSFVEASRLRIIGSAGEDTLLITGDLPLEVEFNGGEGTDHLVFSSGVHTLTSDLGLSTENLRVEGDAVMQVTASQKIGGLIIADDARVILSSGGDVALLVGALELGRAATLDLGDNPLVIRGPPDLRSQTLSSVASLIRAARAGGAWTGPGLTTSVASAYGVVGLAGFSNESGDGQPRFTEAAGVTLEADDIVVRIALEGDANLDGRVDIGDYFVSDRGRALRGAGWVNGDFDHSGAYADADDYMLLDRTFLRQPAAAMVGSGAAPLAAGSMPVWPSAEPLSATSPIGGDVSESDPWLNEEYPLLA